MAFPYGCGSSKKLQEPNLISEGSSFGPLIGNVVSGIASGAGGKIGSVVMGLILDELGW